MKSINSSKLHFPKLRFKHCFESLKKITGNNGCRNWSFVEGYSARFIKVQVVCICNPSFVFSFLSHKCTGNGVLGGSLC